MNYRATVISPTGAMADWNGRKVSIARVIRSPEEGFDAKSLPLFRVVDDRGNRATLRPEELRTEDLADSVGHDDPQVYLEGVPLTNLHPAVRQTIMSTA